MKKINKHTHKKKLFSSLAFIYYLAWHFNDNSPDSRCTCVLWNVVIECLPSRNFRLTTCVLYKAETMKWSASHQNLLPPSFQCCLLSKRCEIQGETILDGGRAGRVHGQSRIKEHLQILKSWTDSFALRVAWQQATKKTLIMPFLHVLIFSKSFMNYVVIPCADSWPPSDPLSTHTRHTCLYSMSWEIHLFHFISFACSVLRASYTICTALICLVTCSLTHFRAGEEKWMTRCWDMTLFWSIVLWSDANNSSHVSAFGLEQPAPLPRRATISPPPPSLLRLLLLLVIIMLLMVRSLLACDTVPRAAPRPLTSRLSFFSSSLARCLQNALRARVWVWKWEARRPKMGVEMAAKTGKRGW